MKIIFLDFDGVLNSDRYIRDCGHTGVVLDPSKMKLLKKITDSTGAKIVLTTSWKEHWDKDNTKCDPTGEQINSIFKQYGLEIYDKTPVIRPDRENEIKKWLEDNPETENFAVLDDMRLVADFLTGHTVKTSAFSDALTEKDAEDTIRILKG
ncbi:MAG: hypothetical protein IJB74_09960 [Clostridia bacterium]|nr:hypothetical protein [Clostridia bacterium]